MATLMVLIALVALVLGVVYLTKRRWMPAGIAGAIFLLALLIHVQLSHAAPQPNNNFPLPLNSGAGAAGTIPK